MDTQQISSFICTCATSSKMITHPKASSKRTLTSLTCRDCHYPVNSVKHKTWSTKRLTSSGTIHDCNKRNMWYHLQHMNKFIHLYSVLCVLCLVTSSVSVENIVIEDQLTQVGHFFFYNISTIALSLGDSFQVKAFEAGRDSLPNWLLFDDTLATFSGVPMEHDVGNTFIIVNMFDGSQLIVDEIFLIEVRPAGAVMLNRKLSKSFLHKISHTGLLDEDPQEQSTEHMSEHREFVQPLHFLPSHCPAVSNELIGNLLVRSMAQLTPAKWVKLFRLLSNSLGIKMNNLYVRNMMYENFGRKALVWGHYVGSDSLAGTPSNKTFTLVSFIIGCSKDSMYSDIYRVVIQRANSLLESVDDNSLLSVLERWFITLEGDDSTEAQRARQRQKRQDAAELPDVQQQDFYVVLTTAVTDVITSSTSIIIPTTTQSPTPTFSSEPILTTTIPVVTVLPSSPMLSVEPTTITPFLTDQTTMGLTTAFMTPIVSTPIVIEPSSSLVVVESSPFLFITSPSIGSFPSSSLIVTVSVSELSSASIDIGMTTLSISIPFSSFPPLSSFATDVMITPSVLLPTPEPTVTTANTTTSTSSLFVSIETFLVTPTPETSIFQTLPLTTSIPVLSPTSIPMFTTPIVPAETSSTSLLLTDLDTRFPTLPTISPTSASSLLVTPFSSEVVFSTQSESIFTDIVVPTVTIEETTIVSSPSAILTSVLTIPSVVETFSTILVETPTSITPVVPFTTLPSMTVQFTDVPTFSFTDTLTPVVTTSISDVLFFTTPAVTSVSSLFTMASPVSSPMLASPTFDATSSVMPTPSSDVVDMLTTEVPDVTLSISETLIIAPTATIVDMTDIFTSVMLSSTFEIPTSTSLVTSFPSVFVTVDTPSTDITTSKSTTEIITFTMVPSFTISSDIAIPSSVVVSMDDTTEIFLVPTSVVTAFSSQTSEPTFPTTTFPFIDTSIFMTPSLTSVIMDATSVMPSLSPSPETTTLSVSIAPTLSSFSPSEDIFTTMLPDVSSTVLIPMTMVSDIMNRSEVPTVMTSPSTMSLSLTSPISETISPTTVLMDTDNFTISSIVMNSSISIEISLPSTMLPSVIPFTSMTLINPTSEISPTISPMDTDTFTMPSVVSLPTEITLPFTTMLPSVIPTPSLTLTSVISEVSSTTIVLVETDTFTMPSITVSSSVPIPPSSMLPSAIPTPSLTLSSVISSTTLVLMETDTIAMSSIVISRSMPTPPSSMLPSVIPTPSLTLSTVISSTTLVLMETDTIVMSSIVMSSSIPIPSSSMLPSVIPTPPFTMLPSTNITTTSEPIFPTTTLINTDTLSLTIPSISSMPASSPLVTTTAFVSPTPTIVIPANTSEVASPSSPIFDETSFIAPSPTTSITTSMVILSMTLPIVNTTDIMTSSQVITPDITSATKLPSVTIVTSMTSIVTTTQVGDITSSTVAPETSAFVPTITPVVPTTITPSPTMTSFSTTVVTTPTPTITNQVPLLINPIGALVWQEGQPAMYEIPEGTFYDSEDGATNNLSLTLQALPGQAVSNTSWIQLINSVLYGLPLNEQIQNSSVTEYVFILTARDSQNAEAHDFIVIVIEPQDPLIVNLITFFVEGDFDLFNEQIIEKIELVTELTSFGPTNTTEDIYIQDFFNGMQSIGLQYGNRTIANSDCTRFIMLIESIFSNETLMYSDLFATAIMPFNVTQIPLAVGPCYDTINAPVTTPPDLDATRTEERSSTNFLATVIPGVVVALILMLVALFACLLYRRTHPGRTQLTFVRRNPIALEAEIPDRQRRRNPALLIHAVHGNMVLTGPENLRDSDPPPYQRPIAYEDYRNNTLYTT